MRSLYEFEKGRGVFDSSSDRLLLKRRSGVDEVDFSKTPPRRRRLVKSHITGRGRTPVFTDLCQDPSTVVRHDSDKSSKPTYLQTLTHFD